MLRLGLIAAAIGCYDAHAPPRFESGPRPRAGNGGDSAGTAADGGGGRGGAGKGGAGSGTAGKGGKPDDAGFMPPERDAGYVATDAGTPGFVESTDPGLRVAFFGDQSLGVSAEAVMQLVKREHADVVVHMGDFAYVPDVEAWNAQIDAVLGPDFPYFAAVGNHDIGEWAGPNGYQALIQARLDRVPGVACRGDLGVNSVCKYRGLVMVLSGVGTYGVNQEDFIEEALDDLAVWRLCLWHKNQHDMQAGVKSDEVGWRAYQICEAHGAPIITAHEHSYARSYTLTAVGDRNALHGYVGEPDEWRLAPGSTGVLVSGLGGHSYRPWNGESAPWWSSIYAANLQLRNAVTVGVQPELEFGALFIDFHIDEDPYKAHAYFKTTSDKIIDDFTIHVAH